MEIRFNRTGAERKALVTAIGEILEMKPKYCGMPSASYRIGAFNVDKSGTVSFDERQCGADAENLLHALADRGFTAERLPDTAAETEYGNISEQADEAAGNAPQGETSGLTVTVPRDTLSDTAIENLKRIAASKSALLKKALGTDSLRIEVSDEQVSFPWFAQTDGDSVKAYTHLIAALCEMARHAKRVTATEKETENEKYAFRCFLLRLGFIGTEYKAERKILLKNLSGNSAFKNRGADHALSE